MNKKFRILSLDGGGLRGLAELIILKEIEEMTGKRIYELFDLIVGTSTGGIIACGLTASKNGRPILTVDKLIDLYFANGDKIFPRQDNYIKKAYRSIRSLFMPEYSYKGLDEKLTEYFGDIRLSEVLTPIIVTSYDVAHNEIIMFKSRRSKESFFDLSLKDVCRATSAAPTYLSSYKLNYMNVNRILIDGGISVNNPSMVAISDVLKNVYGTENIKVEDIQLLSLGTGFMSEDLGYKKTWRWGKVQWAKPISTIMLQSSSKCVEYECKQLPLDKFLRLQFLIDDKNRADMSDSRLETCKYIIDCTNDQILNKKYSEIKNFFD